MPHKTSYWFGWIYIRVLNTIDRKQYSFKNLVIEASSTRPVLILGSRPGVRLKMCFRTQLSVIHFSHVSVLYYGQHDQ